MGAGDVCTIRESDLEWARRLGNIEDRSVGIDYEVMAGCAGVDDWVGWAKVLIGRARCRRRGGER
jgi:hypothetical protein